MENLNVLIIEKQGNDDTSIHNLITDKFPHYSTVTTIVSNIQDICDHLKKTTYDLILLDTDVHDGNLFDYLEPYIDAITDGELIVISSSTQFAIDSFKFSPIDYILKPIRHIEMDLALQRVRSNIIKQKLIRDGSDIQHNVLMPRVPVKIVAIPSLTEVKILPVDTIVYLQSDGKYTTFHTTDNKTIVSSRNLGVYEKLLSNNNFFRIHHSYIVNVDLACNVYKKDGTYLEIFNKKYLPISKRKAESFYKFLGI